ncbi:MAG: thioredoxin domain-containing protein [Candidatus Paceibacterota bacterium]
MLRDKEESNPAVMSRRTRVLCLVLLGLGACISGYLLYHHLAPAPGLGLAFCSAVFGASCEETLRSPLAIQLGLPLAGWGLVYYGTLAALLLLGWAVGDAFHFSATLGALLLSLLGAVVSVGLLAAMASGVAPLCPLCAIVHVVNLALVFPLKRLTGHTTRELAGAVTAAGRYLLGRDPTDPQQARWQGVGFLTAALVGVAIYQWVYVQHTVRSAHAQAAFDAEETLVLFETLAPQPVKYRTDDAQTANPDAPVHLVVFSDFQCPGCTKFARALEAVRQRFSDRVHVVFQHFPLSNQCNPLIDNPFHPRACEAARAAEAARRQDRFWAYHDALFAANLPANEDVSLVEVAKQVGLDIEQFQTDRQSDAVAAKVQENVEQGVALALDGTPAVFLNSRRVYDLRLQALEFLIQHELEHHIHDGDGRHEHATEELGAK